MGAGARGPAGRPAGPGAAGTTGAMQRGKHLHAAAPEVPGRGGLPSPLVADLTEDFTPISGRRPLRITILDSPHQLASVSAQLPSSMVVLLGCGVATVLTTALGGGGAKQVRVFRDAQAAAECGEREFRQASRWVVGGEGAHDVRGGGRGVQPADYLEGLRGKAVLYASPSAADAVDAGAGLLPLAS
jgi:hypothetical protein